MPRKGRGGKVNPTPQTAYPNRTDLTNPNPMQDVEQIQRDFRPIESFGSNVAKDVERGFDTLKSIDNNPSEKGINNPLFEKDNLKPFNNNHQEPGTLKFLHPTDRPEEHITSGLKPNPFYIGMVQPNMPGGQPPMLKTLGTLLTNAANHPNATAQVQELAALAVRLGI